MRDLERRRLWRLVHATGDPEARKRAEAADRRAYARDPRLEPRRGDVVEGDGERWKVERRGTRAPSGAKAFAFSASPAVEIVQLTTGKRIDLATWRAVTQGWRVAGRAPPPIEAEPVPSAIRCAYCHDAADTLPTCPCGGMHLACIAEHGSCVACSGANDPVESLDRLTLTVPRFGITAEAAAQRSGLAETLAEVVLALAVVAVLAVALAVTL